MTVTATTDKAEGSTTARRAPRRREAGSAGHRARSAGLFVVLFAVWIGLWQASVSWGLVSPMAPSPAETWARMVELFSRAFHSDGVNSVGIGWHLLASLRRVLTGFLLAAAVALPLGFLIGRSRLVGDAVDPFVQVLRPVSPLAWLPLGLALFQDSELTALFVIFMTALWPILLNTVSGVREVDPAYLDLARTLETGRLTVVRRILLPAALPSIVTGLRVSLSVAWLVIIAAEMLSGGRGMGYFVWNEWNNLNVASILVAILVIGVTGLVLDRVVQTLERLAHHD